MKRIAVVVILINLFIAFGCGITRVDPEKGKALAENLLRDLQQERFDDMDRYFIASFNEDEPLESKTAKYRRILQTAGAITSFEVVDESQRYDDPSGYNQLTLVYKVHCARLPLRVTFIVVKDEGRTGIIFQHIENWEG